MGQVPRVGPGYLELSFSSMEKEKRTESCHEGSRFRRAVPLWAPASCMSSRLSDDTRELIRSFITYSDSFCCSRIPLSVSGQTTGQKRGETLLLPLQL